MRIVILGAGQVGSSVAESLASEQNDLTVVDIDAKRLRALQDRLDLRTVTGSASHPSVLVQAGIGLFIGRLPPPLLPMLAHELLGIAALQVLVALLYAAGAGAHGGDATAPAP